MIHLAKGNLLAHPAAALVNTVNLDGVMGKGIALHFKEQYPENYRRYRAACQSKAIQIGKMFITERNELIGPRWIINFPTKITWRKPSELSYIKTGLVDLVQQVRVLGIQSIALPPLGCGNGGLRWSDVKPLIAAAFADLPEVEVSLFEPTETRTLGMRLGSDAITPARAVIYEAMRLYASLESVCTLIEVQKLGYFLERVAACLQIPSPLQLHFEPNRYGPYADPLRHVMRAMEGSFIACDVALADVSPQTDALRLVANQQDRVHAFFATNVGAPIRHVLEVASQIWKGFETPFGMELLATVDWLQSHNNWQIPANDLVAAVARWPHAEGAARKARIFDDRVLRIADAHLRLTLLAQCSPQD